MTAREMVQKAYEKGQALLAVNAVNLETAQAVVRGAEEAGKPVFLMFSHNALRYGGLEELAALGKVLRGKAKVPVYLHLDHAEDLELLEAAFRLGFDSAMVEEGPMEFLLEARRVAGERPLELEVEVVPKGERSGQRRPVEELMELIGKTRPDWVAVDLGTVHKSLSPRRLELSRLEGLASLRKPMVLHGGSSADPKDLARATALGVAKVNVATRAFAAFTAPLRERLGEEVDPRKYLGPAREGMAAWVRQFLAAPFFAQLPK